jgi:hypothetical protein
MLYEKPFRGGLVSVFYLYQEGRDVYFYNNDWKLKKISKMNWKEMIHPSSDPLLMLNWGRNVVPE